MLPPRFDKEFTLTTLEGKEIKYKAGYVIANQYDDVNFQALAYSPQGPITVLRIRQDAYDRWASEVTIMIPDNISPWDGTSGDHFKTLELPGPISCPNFPAPY